MTEQNNPGRVATESYSITNNNKLTVGEQLSFYPGYSPIDEKNVVQFEH